MIHEPANLLQVFFQMTIDHKPKKATNVAFFQVKKLLFEGIGKVIDWLGYQANVSRAGT